MIPASLRVGLRVPAIAAPMFLVSGPKLVIETCKAGVIGTFPALNARTDEILDQWLQEIRGALAKEGDSAARFGINLIVHKTNNRLQKNLEMVVKHKVPLVITSLGAVKELVDAVHSYGGVVFHDVTNTRHAEKAAQAGVDGLIAVCSGAGGHAGQASAFALIPKLRKVFNGTVVVAGAISNGQGIAAARALGGDLAYLGTRFIATKESNAQQEYKEMIVKEHTGPAPSFLPTLYTDQISGVYANFLRKSLTDAGVDLKELERRALAGTVVHEDFSKLQADEDFGRESKSDTSNQTGKKESGAWKDIWSAGHGVLTIDDIPSTKELCERLAKEYEQAIANLSKAKL